jgi:hypothetical protein
MSFFVRRQWAPVGGKPAQVYAAVLMNKDLSPFIAEIMQEALVGVDGHVTQIRLKGIWS